MISLAQIVGLFGQKRRIRQESRGLPGAFPTIIRPSRHARRRRQPEEKQISAAAAVQKPLLFAGPSGAPEFLADKISTSSTSLSVVWRPPPAATLNGEFLGYEMTYRPAAAIAAAAASDNDIGAGAG